MDRRQAGAGAGDEPDVLLDTLVKVGDLALEVEGLRAHVSVRAEVADLSKLSVAADVDLDRFNAMAQDVEVQAFLKVRLDEVRAILDKSLTAIGEKPEILLGALNSRDIAAGEIGTVRDAAAGRGAVSDVTEGMGEAEGRLVGLWDSPASQAAGRAADQAG